MDSLYAPRHSTPQLFLNRHVHAIISQEVSAQPRHPVDAALRSPNACSNYSFPATKSLLFPALLCLPDSFPIPSKLAQRCMRIQGVCRLIHIYAPRRMRIWAFVVANSSARADVSCPDFSALERRGDRRGRRHCQEARCRCDRRSVVAIARQRRQ
jgi:hypothetical protein